MVDMLKNSKIFVFSTVADLAQAISHDFLQRVTKVLDLREACRVVLPGGNTPKIFFDTLVSDFSQKIPWTRLQFFFSDERYAPINNVENNYHMVNEHLFSRVPIPRENIFRISTESQDPFESAKHYQSILRKILHEKEDESPLFDAVYLGLGEDGHTASLFPYSAPVMHALKENDASLVSALRIESQNMFRITLTPEAINNSGSIVFLVSGPNKSHAVQSVLKGPLEPQKFPAQLIRCKFGETCWYLDEAAADYKV